MASSNYNVLHTFVEGLKADFINHAESNNSYQNSLNGRLYSRNGILSFSSISGTKKVWKNSSLKKYLGYWAFDDELIIFCKSVKEIDENNQDPDIDYELKKQLTIKNFSVDVPFGLNSKTVDIEPYISEISIAIPVNPNTNIPLLINIPFNCELSSDEEIDLSNYYDEIITSDSKICSIPININPESNLEDRIYSLKKNDSGEIYSKLLWRGNLGWNENYKIITLGINENNFYKRIYFSDYLGSLKVINIKDKSLTNRRAEEFNVFQSAVMLQPRIISIENRGQIKAGTVMYCYRLITENGQVSEFSPISEDVKILKNNSSLNYSGGDIDEVTSKSVKIACDLANYYNYNEIECIAIEYQAFGSPTAIRSLGIKKVSSIVEFEHYGNEEEFGSNLTLSQILNRKNTWEYCSDLSSKKNILIASALRNKPLPSELINMGNDFLFHGWDSLGNTHNCLINPTPSVYRYICPSNKNNMFYSSKKMYSDIQVFGDFIVRIVNLKTNEFLEKSFVAKKANNYNDYLLDVFEWINESSNFSVKFPGIEIEYIQSKILFSSNNDFDFYDLKFEFNTEQVIIDYQDEITLKNLSVNGDLVYGAESLGFNKGNGIRVTWKTKSNLLLTKSQSNIKPFLNLTSPSTDKFFMKGEIYRIGINCFDTKGSKLFTIPCGDIMAPKIGDKKKYIDGNGNVVLSDETYKNSYVLNDNLYSEGILMNVEVRLSCEIQKLVSMYQIVYVERTEDNRTILCQGISGPMQRVNQFYRTEHVNIKDEIANKWCLPYIGAAYDKWGLERFDINPNENNTSDSNKRVITNRKLIYFDSPELIYDRISTEKIKNGFVQRIGRLNPDLNKDSYHIRASGSEVFPLFSRAIYKDDISGSEDEKPYRLDLSVFIEKEGIDNLIEIEYSEDLPKGKIISGTQFGYNQEISNNSLVLGRPSWFFSENARRDQKCSTENGLKYELFRANNFAIGSRTCIIKTTEEIFSDNFISQTAFKINIAPDIDDKLSYYGSLYAYDTHALVNIVSNSEDNIYGGKTELAFSKNVYTALSKTIPVLKTTNSIQKFTVNGDVYCSLYMRMKESFNNGSVNHERMNNYSNCSRNKFEEKEFNRKSGWLYAVVIESTIEPRWTFSQELFYRNSGKIDLSSLITERINEAYFQNNNLISYIPKPFRFKDDPNLNNIVATSEPKLNGDYYDKWTSFRVNDFYELEKDKGTAFNLAKFLDQIYVIQENQISTLQINENVMVPTSAGDIGLQQGTGNRITGHEAISDFGTSIRRAIIESISSNKDLGGFTFFDEKRLEWVKNNNPILFKNNYHLKMKEIFENDPIVDSEGYYDNEYKETNIRFITKSGKSYMLSYNEAFNVFNGWLGIESNLFLVWNENVFAPKFNLENSKNLHQLNKGAVLEFFDSEQVLKIEITINVNPTTIKIFKEWEGILNINYPIKKMKVKTSSGQERIISGKHHRYKIQENRHSVPLKNRLDTEDLRGDWATLEIEIEKKSEEKIDVFGFINFVRHSYR